DQGRGAALEDRAGRPAGKLALALVAASAGLTVSRAGPATHALALLVLANAAIHFGEVHVRVTPRRRSISCRVRSVSSALMAALTWFVGLLEPKLLVRMLWMPAASQTARTALPAITPVPGAAGTSTTRAAP